jgi:hypothetical protein
MGCHFCKNEIWNVYTNANCDYCICWDCWEIQTRLVSNKEQSWKLIQLRGDKIRETL